MKQFLKDSFKAAVPGFLAMAMTILLFFCIFRYNGLNNAIEFLVAILRPFIYGGVMAYLLKTPYNWLEKKLSARFSGKKQGMAKALSLLIVLAVTFLIIFLLISMVVPALASSIVRIINRAPAALNRLEKFVSSYTQGSVFQKYIEKLVEGIKNNGMDWIKKHILPRLQSLMGEFASTFGALVGLLYNVFLGIIICVYLLLSKKTFARQGKMVIYALFDKKFAGKILDEFAFIDKTFVGFFAGKILDSVVVGLICYVFCLIMHFTMGMQNIVLIAVIVGVTNIIPYFGPYIGVVPTALLVLMDSPVLCVIYIIFIILLQQFDGNFLGPLFLSGSVGLSGFWVLFSITFFGGLMGFVGILIGVPVFAIIYDLIRRFIYFCLKKKNINISEITEEKNRQPVPAKAEAPDTFKTEGKE